MMGGGGGFEGGAALPGVAAPHQRLGLGLFTLIQRPR